MITITQAAAERIRQSVAESGEEQAVLRIAAKLSPDGSVEFGMGFDQSRPGDTTEDVEGIMVVVAEASRELVEGVRLDFVELEPGEFRFIFAAPEAAPGE